jgi:hypothetical protein
MKEKVCLDRSNWVIGDKIQRRAVYAQGSLTQIASLRKKPRKVERSRPTEKMAENFRIGIFFFLSHFIGLRGGAYLRRGPVQSPLFIEQSGPTGTQVYIMIDSISI